MEAHEEEEVEVKDEDKLVAEVHPGKGMYISPFLLQNQNQNQNQSRVVNLAIMPDQVNKLTIYPSCLSKTIPLHPEIGKLILIPPVINQGRIAGLVREAATNWSKITSDKTILKMVQGYSIQFIDDPPANLKTYQPSFSNQERALISDEIEKMKLKGAILEVPLPSTNS